jgi:hypothetical protein
MTASTINSAATYQIEIERIFTVYVNGWVPLVAQVIGIIGNIMNVIVFSTKTMTSSSHVYLCALAITDLIGITLFVPLLVGYAFEIRGMVTLTGFVAHYICYTNGLTSSFGLASVWIIVALSIERCIAISWPLKAKSMCTRSRARKVISLIYILAFVVSIPSFLKFTCGYVSDKESNTTIFALTRSEIISTQPGSFIFHTTLLLFMNVIPLALLIIFNSLLIWRLRQMTRARTTLAKETSSSQKSK